MSLVCDITLEQPHVTQPLDLRITYPSRSGGGQYPTVVFSHGADLKPALYHPLIAQWAAAGLVVLQPLHRHYGPDTAPWLQRVYDVHLVAGALDIVERAVPALAGRLDRQNLKVAGHSFGGHTAALVLGAMPRSTHAAGLDLAHPGIVAGVLLAPPGDAETLVAEWAMRAPYLDVDWQPMTRPALVVIGTDDAIGMDRRGWRWRADAFKLSAAGNKTLIVVPGSDHYFGGIACGRGGDYPLLRSRLAALTATFLLKTADDPSYNFEAGCETDVLHSHQDYEIYRR